MRLYYHPESDGLFWDHFCDDPMCEDVTDEARFQDAAAERGIFCPGPISKVIDAPEKKLWEDGRDPMGVDALQWTLDQAKPTGGMAGAIQASYKKWERKPSDFYPTPYDGTESLIPLIEKVREHAAPDRRFRVWEPCSGDLDMSRVLEWHGYEVTSTELRDTGQGITGIDFLTDDPQTKLGWEPDPDMIVMNPPFSLAAEFIAKALSYTPNVACLVKIDYWNAISRLPLFEQHRPHFFLPLTFRLAFLKAERGNSPLMNCAWVVWTDDSMKEDLQSIGIDGTLFEPLRKRVYPGYQGNGIRTSLAKLGQALDDLTGAVCNARSEF